MNTCQCKCPKVPENSTPGKVSCAQCGNPWIGREAARIPVKVQARIGRNDPCSCGSGIKFKKCCWQRAVEQSNVYASYQQAVKDLSMLNSVPAEVAEKYWPGELERVRKYVEDATPWAKNYERNRK